MRGSIRYALHHARAALRDVMHPAVLFGAALLVAAFVAQPGITRTAPDLLPTPTGVSAWWLGPPAFDERQAQRFTRGHRASVAQRQEVASIVVAAAQRHGVDPALAVAVAEQESGLRPAHTVTGPPTRYGRAVGTMQVLPATGRGEGCGDLRRTHANVECGVRYLAQGLRRCGGDMRCAARFYHGGPSTRLHGPRTAHYERAVMARYARHGGRRGHQTFFASTRGGLVTAGAPACDDRFPHLTALGCR
jgi:soluble lytic murein transglycosylase-like protein